MKRFVAMAAVILCSTSAYAFSPTLKNEDSKKYTYKIKCGGSTLNSSINGNTLQTLSGKAGCTLDVAGAGSAKLADDMKCKIKNGSLSCS